MDSGSSAPPILAGRYELEHRIGAGGAGVVWRATDNVLGRRVALKLLDPALERDPDAVARFRREAVTAAALNHPNAVAIYDIGHDDGRDFLVIELVDGPPLAQLLDGPLDPRAVAAIGHQVARALGAAHDRGMIHRDVKPANVLIDRAGIAKVADFGIAKALGDAQARLTATGTVVGTAAYLAPEQLRDADVDARADVYALGLVLHECLTGAPPFDGATAVEVAAQRLSSDPRRPSRPGIPEGLADVIVRATRADRDERYRDGAELAAALAPFVPDRPDRVLAALVATVAGEDADATVLIEAPQTPLPDETIPLEVPSGATTELIGHEPTAHLSPEPDGHATGPVDRTADEPGRTGPPAPVEQTPPPTTPDDAGPSAGGDVRRALVAFGVLATVLVLVVIALTSGGTDPSGEGAQGGGDGPAVLPIVTAHDFDPLGDGREHADEVAFTFDGDPDRGWTSERYDSRAFGNLKAGIGVWFELKERHEVQRFELVTSAPGMDLQLFASDEPFRGGDPAGWGRPVGELVDAPADAAIDLPDDAAGRYWLVWIRRLPDTRRAAIDEVRLIAR